MLVDYKVYLMSVDLLTPSSLERIGKLVSLNHDPAAAADGVDISYIFHCDGLSLCITKDITNPRVVVWNPYGGYALGYENNNCSLPPSHKVLRFVDFYDWSLNCHVREFELYSCNSNSWKVVVDVNPDWSIEFCQRGVSLKGNIYLFAEEKLVDVAPGTEISDLLDFLLCFDFTKERFGPRLPLPFHSFGDIVTLSSVGQEKLAVLFQKQGLPPYTVKIWISSSKIEPDAVSWNKLFLSVDMKPLTGFLFLDNGGSFFVDEDEEVAVVLDKARGEFRLTHNTACIIGRNGHFKQVDLGERADPSLKLPTNIPVVCSYVPSSVDIM
ncbi:hypothetical protein Bca101_073159 [Brassica carinata]